MGHSAAGRGVDRSRQGRGAWGEEQAARHYRSLGFEVVGRNWRCADGELDLVARRGALVVFCEVKARRSDAYGAPAEAVTAAKQRRLRRLGAAWLAAAGVHDVEVRFDVVSVLGTKVELIEAAF
jgi:putative endonuclease